jgi:hypothetical protein
MFGKGRNGGRSKERRGRRKKGRKGEKAVCSYDLILP